MMRTKVIKISRHMPEWGAVSLAAGVIGSGGIVCMPTDTIYGFTASIYCREAIERLREIKQRGGREPFVVLVSDIDQVRELTVDSGGRRGKLIERHWPGALTIVFKASPVVPDYVRGPGETVAVRVPDDVLTQSVLRACGTPLAAPSANSRGERPALCPEDVLRRFRGKIDLLLDGGDMESDEPSTIVAVRGGDCQILRRGRVSLGKVRS
jgi:L-threonylcarbamoyladenylate synthase